MKQTAVEWLKVTVKSMIENGEDADLYAVLWHIEQAREMEKERMFEVYHGYQDYLDNEFKNQCGGQSVILTFEEYYNKTFNTEEMTREEKLETIVKVFAKIMFYGDWEWGTPNERVITMLMQEVGMYPFKDEDDMISKTPVNDELYKKAIKEVPSRQVKGWDESIPVNTNEK